MKLKLYCYNCGKLNDYSESVKGYCKFVVQYGEYKPHSEMDLECSCGGAVTIDQEVGVDIDDTEIVAFSNIRFTKTISTPTPVEWVGLNGEVL